MIPQILQPSTAIFSSPKRRQWTTLFWFIVYLLTVSPFMPAIAPCCQAADKAKSSTHKPRIVFLGDSITAGYGLKKEQAYPSLIGKLAEAESPPLQLAITNAGLSGDTTRGGLRRVAVLMKKPMDLLVIALGGNDGLRGLQPEVSQANLEAIIDLARKTQPKIKILLVGMQMPENMGASYIAAFEKMYPAIAKKKGVELLPFLLEGVAGDSSLNLADQIHPNAQGQVIIADHVYKALQPQLKNEN